MELSERYRKFLRKTFVSAQDRDIDSIVAFTEAAYQRPPRAYHSLEYHITFCLDQLKYINSMHILYRRALEHALWLHDYANPSLPNHPELSCQAALVHCKLLGIYAEEYIKALLSFIMATDYHIDKKYVPKDFLIIRDIDCAIFGASREKFLEYRNKIREEYPGISDEKFKTESLNFFKMIINSKPIFLTQKFQSLYEDQARENITWVIKNLYAPV